mmetsp:Transcript_11758/g.24048  ORF Transcript_11758/g.24048 Transcript_11758/m.24048 type:complete len:112 (+) Transcript_11758:179-514(+)|eukprot:CAMPEP_0118646790 /NCGR_PEP_ID=MMETSP0785-20121206/8255_1 /TAXON_ID=91992 /ORGANISM="Bolidomonas pacifica, Strain CCMP 1866" /LENGTH=111 /DNA_ID=CAMNT_0006538829 /DNA_START=127 /DNA_END=462 /DNA_ORIENTATION=-
MMFRMFLLLLMAMSTLSFMPPLACMCASGDGRLTDDYLSSLSPIPDKHRITPANYEWPEYIPPKLHTDEEDKTSATATRVRKRDKVKAFFKASVKKPIKNVLGKRELVGAE